MTDKNFVFWCQKTIPLVFDNSLSYYECLCKLLNFVNSLTTDVAEIARLQQELQNYVENYFNNLDIQKEINNKLDEMVNDGTLSNIINEEIFNDLNNKLDNATDKINKLYENTPAKFNFINLGESNGESTAIEIENNNLLIDLGAPNSFNSLIGYLVGNGITKFKYILISHWDIDHSNSFENFKSLLDNNNFNFTECIFILPPKINWSLTTGLEGQEQRETEFTNYLLANGYNIKYPNEEEIITLDDNNFIKFYNCSESYYNEYYSIKADDAGNPTSTTAYNNFSVVCEINSCNKSFLFTGDIYYNAENNICDKIKTVDLIKIPHHGLNRYSNSILLKKIRGAIGIITSTLKIPPLRPHYTKLKNSNGEIYSTLNNGNCIFSIYNGKIINLSNNDSYFQNNKLVIEENDNLNNYILNGTYILNNENIINTVLNKPYNYNSQFLLDVIQITSTVVYQFIKTLNVNPIIWVRKTVNKGTIWTEWIQLYNNSLNLITLGLEEQFLLNNNNFNKIPFTQTLLTNNGTNITYEENGFKIGKGINFVEVSATVSFQNLNENDRINLAIYLNNNAFNRIDKVSNANYDTLTISSIISVKENDKIELFARNLNTTNSSIVKYSYSTNFTIKSIG